MDEFNYRHCLLKTGITEEQKVDKVKKNKQGITFNKICWKGQNNKIKDFKICLNKENVPEHFAYIKFYKKTNDTPKALCAGKTCKNSLDFEFAQFATFDDYNKQLAIVNTPNLGKSPGINCPPCQGHFELV